MNRGVQHTCGHHWSYPVPHRTDKAAKAAVEAGSGSPCPSCGGAPPLPGGKDTTETMEQLARAVATGRVQGEDGIFVCTRGSQ